jgi:hypothetical protein
VTLAKQTPFRSLAPRLLGGVVSLVAGFMVSLGLQYALHQGAAPTAQRQVGTKSEIAPLHVDVQTEPVTARLWLDGHAVGTGRYAGAVHAGSQHELLVEADGHAPQRLTFRDRAPAGRIALLPASAVDDTRADARAAPLPAAPTPTETAAQAGTPELPSQRATAPELAARRARQLATQAEKASSPARADEPAPSSGSVGRDAARAAELAPSSEAAPTSTPTSATKAPKVRVIDERAPHIRVIE